MNSQKQKEVQVDQEGRKSLIWWTILGVALVVSLTLLWIGVKKLWKKYV